ncbi:hypothetical protein IE53DRAFT_108099 [Violaceomyces palustris]|uniref:Uncharacterized protein n=1 Tax=Violaceomyces palustris TaxID=1673888 RepID=A0ACD0P6L0_9BASI|nr:hypothetical protein IE53DRAFT_108099 [Violaceomyces palustris]
MKPSTTSHARSPPCSAPIEKAEFPDPEKIPLLVKDVRRFTNTRRKQILRAASRGSGDPPPPPGPDECCGSSCDPCVKQLWREELMAWSQRWGTAAVAIGEDGRAKVEIEIQGDPEAEGDRQDVKGGTMPGSYDW